MKKLSSQRSTRASERQRLRNRMVKSKVKTLTKRFLESVDAKQKDVALTRYNELSSYLDKAVNKGVLHRNTAARNKSRMRSLLNAVSA